MSKWTYSEDVELYNKVDEYGKKWTIISSFFPNKSPGSVQKHYIALQNSQFSPNNNSNSIESIDQNRSNIEIKKILQKTLRNKEKISQLSKFANNLIFQAIIEFSLEFPTANPSLSLLLLDMFENIEYPKKIFLEISKNIECKSLLQFCRTFSVLNDDDLQIIDYIQSDKFSSKDQYLEKNRKTL